MGQTPAKEDRRSLAVSVVNRLWPESGQLKNGRRHRATISRDDRNIFSSKFSEIRNGAFVSVSGPGSQDPICPIVSSSPRWPVGPRAPCRSKIWSISRPGGKIWSISRPVRRAPGALIISTPSIGDSHDGNAAYVVADALEAKFGNEANDPSVEAALRDAEDAVRAVSPGAPIRFCVHAAPFKIPCAEKFHKLLVNRGYDVWDEADAFLVRPGGTALPDQANFRQVNSDVTVSLLDISEAPIRDLYDIQFRGTPYFGDSGWYLARHAREIERSRPGMQLRTQIALVCVDGSPASFVSIHSFLADDNCFIGFVGTRDGFRRKGLASLALRTALEATKGNVWLSVSNADARRIYEGLFGFREVANTS